MDSFWSNKQQSCSYQAERIVGYHFLTSCQVILLRFWIYNSAVTFRWATNSSFSTADQTISVPAQSSWYLSTQSTGRFYIGHGVVAALPCPKWQYICKQLSNPPPTTSRFNLESDWICVIYHVTDACPLLCWAFAAGLCMRKARVVLEHSHK